MPPSPRLCIDVSNTLESASLSGIQRVTLELMGALAECSTVVPLDGRGGRFVAIRPAQGKRLDRLKAGRGGRSIAQRIETRAIRAVPAARQGFIFDSDTVLLDVEASWHAPLQRTALLAQFQTPSAALIHDILPITNADWFPQASVERFHAWFDAHIAADSTLLAVSNASADAVAATGAPRPTVIRMGSTLSTTATTTANGILMVGTIEPRKGHAVVLDALDLLGDQAPIIDVVGRPGWDTIELIDRLERHPHVRWHHSLDDVDLEALWSLTGLLLQPSLGEGFGLPVVEALQRGIAVASSDIPVMREIGRGQTTLLPSDPAIWAQTLRSFSDEPAAWPQPDQLAWPTWHDSATDTINALIAAGVWSDAASANQ